MKLYDDKKQAIGIVVACIIAMAIIFIPFPTQKVNPEDAVVAIEVTSIYGQSWGGSGTIVNEDGLILSVAHVLADAAQVKVTLKDGRSYDIDPNTIYVYPDWERFDEGADVGFCRITSDDVLPWIPMAKSSGNLGVGTEIEIIGHPLWNKYWHSYGHLSRGVQNGQLQMDIDSNPGNSGCPVIYNDEVIGVIAWGYQATDLSFGAQIELCWALREVYELIVD